MEPIYKIGWRPLKQKDHRQLRTTAEEQYQKEQQRIENKKQQFSNLKDFREKMYYGSRNDKRQIWEKMNQELNQQRSVTVFIFKKFNDWCCLRRSENCTSGLLIEILLISFIQHFLELGSEVLF